MRQTHRILNRKEKHYENGLDRREVAEGLSLLTPPDEIWAKLEAGTQ